MPETFIFHPLVEKSPASRCPPIFCPGCLCSKVINCAKFHIDRSRGLGSVGTQKFTCFYRKATRLNIVLSATALARDIGDIWYVVVLAPIASKNSYDIDKRDQPVELKIIVQYLDVLYLLYRYPTWWSAHLSLITKTTTIRTVRAWYTSSLSCREPSDAIGYVESWQISSDWKY